MLRLPSLFTDGLVLCRRKEIRIFGEAPEGEEIRVLLKDRQGSPLARGAGKTRNGRFLVFLGPQEAQTGCELVIEEGTEKRTIRDVAVGEVFLAGGQSNMELPLSGADGGPERIRVHNDPLLRFYNVPKRAYACEEQRKALEDARWEKIAPGEGAENSAVAYFFACRLREAQPGLPVGIIGCYWGGTSITCWMEEETLRSLAEGARYLDDYARDTAGKTMETFLAEEKVFLDAFNGWNRQVAEFRSKHPEAPWKDVEAACGICPWNPPAGPGSPYRPAGLAETMLHAVAPVTLTGILFYQGEEDTWKTDRYDELMLLLIRRWRQLFRDPELPFLYVQLPMWLDTGAEDTFLWPKLRLAQAAARDAARNTGMICLLDQGEYGNIHPTAKKPVGDRLYELAAHMLYGGGELSPRAVARACGGGMITVRLSAPVTARDGKPPRLMEIAGDDGVFRPAACEIGERELRIHSPEVEYPVSVRYAWTDYSDQVNLFGLNGLPLEPFRL